MVTPIRRTAESAGMIRIVGKTVSSGHSTNTKAASPYPEVGSRQDGLMFSIVQLRAPTNSDRAPKNLSARDFLGEISLAHCNIPVASYLLAPL